MSEQPAELRSVIVERAFDAPPEKLWRALTQPHLIEEWLMKNDFRPVRGHKFTLRREPKPGVHVVVDCEVLAVEPHRTLTYRWSAFGLDSVVTFTLTPTATGTLLRMEQAGFGPDQERAFRGAKASWPQMLDALDALLKTLD